MENKIRAPRNRTVELREEEREEFEQKLLDGADIDANGIPDNSTINDDMRHAISFLPDSSIDLLILDPPYNLTKQFQSSRFVKRNLAEYTLWLRGWFGELIRTLKPHATVYICSDWATSPAIYDVASEYLTIRNRITWEREKGRGAAANWKNCSEDIWFGTVGEDYTFNIDAVRLKRRVVAPYRNNGAPKGWEAQSGGNYRLTAPSNLWTDVTVPFWSMPENTDHPTQKPEKLIAKLILASSRENDLVLDPFLGSGTTSVVCRKLGRRYIGIEIEREFCLLAEKRLHLAANSKQIQGYENGEFLERNTLKLQMQQRLRSAQGDIFST
jgi:site-specific DNA-methyltransferase (adenine-specific)